MTYLPLNVDVPQDPSDLRIDGHGFHLASTWSRPDSRPEPSPLDCWVHRERRGVRRVLAGRLGELVEDHNSAMGMEMVRQVWIGDAGDGLAVRLLLRNRNADAIRLDSLVPLRFDGPGALLIQGATAGGWDVLAQQRLKNGIPTALRPGIYDNDYAHAAKGATELGGTPSGDGSRVDGIEMDPFCLIRRRGDETSPILLIGYLSQTGHCARLLLRWRADGETTGLESLIAECEFDGTLLPPGGERTSQWCFVRAGHDADELVSDYADRVGRYHSVMPPPQPAPSVNCSYYFYGPYFREIDFVEDLGYLEGDRIPFDVFLIDECWDMSWGDWEPDENWPSGMKAAADRIRALGYRPAIWTCPFLAKYSSQLARTHPEWLLRLDDGSPHLFFMGGFQNYVLDPTYPGVCDYIEALFRKMTEDWGYTYHKLDFTRAVFLNKRARFHDPTATRLAAYRLGLEAVRRGAGTDAYISVCGGHYGGSLGLADSQRSGSDVTAMWDHPPAMPKFKQNLLRSWMNRLWHVDPDAMMVRRRDEPFNDTGHARLSLGKFTDDEAETIAVNQYLGGGLVCFTERFLELDADRKALYRHVIPSVGAESVPLDIFSPDCPSQILTRIQPRCQTLPPWVTLAVINWSDEPREMAVTLGAKVTECLAGERFLVYDLIGQEWLGIHGRGGVVELGSQAPHKSRLLRIAPRDGVMPALVGTDLHYSGGGVEIAGWEAGPGQVSGRIATRWDYPVRITAAFPDGDGVSLASTTVPAGQAEFTIRP